MPVTPASTSCPCSAYVEAPTSNVARFHEGLRRFAADLDEKNRRRLAGLLALEHGHGGVQRWASVLGLSRTTVLLGRRELETGALGSHERVRPPGGGRKPALIRPGLVDALETLMRDEAGGDPVSGVR